MRRDSESPSFVPPIIDLRIPGPWASRDAFIDALEDATLGYDVDEDDLVHRASGRRFELRASPHDDEIAQVFAGAGRITKADVARIASHAVKVHLSIPVGSIEDKRAIVQAAAAVVRAGGLGVMVDNSGACHNTDDWLALANDTKPGGVYWAFVVVTHDGKGTLYSTGMHCLGLHDAEMPAPPDLEYGGFVLHNFLGYTYQSGMEVNDGDPIGDENGVTHHLRHIPCTRYPRETPFHNPYGVWRLEPVDDEKDREGK